MKSSFALLLATALLVTPALTRADQASHRATAEQLLMIMDMEKSMTQSIDQMLAMQMKQNPQMSQFEPQMKAFFGKYLNWAAVKDDMVTLYMSEFTEPELKELIAFYQTPVGKKTVQKLPALLQKSAELSQRRLQEHLPELQQSIQSAAASSAGGAGASPAGANPAAKGSPSPAGASPAAKGSPSPAKKNP